MNFDLEGSHQYYAVCLAVSIELLQFYPLGRI
jgi:hypothetical protein